MGYKIVQCIDNIDNFNADEFINNNIGIEIQDIAYPALLDNNWEDRVDKYLNKLISFNNLITIHGACLDLNPASNDKKIVKVTEERYYLSINIAKKLKAKYIVFHSQINPGLKNPKVKEIKIKRQLNFWNDIYKEIKDTDITIVIENLFEPNPIDLLNLIEAINNDKIKICLDIGHINVNSEILLNKWIAELSKHIKYIHLHWNNGAYDQHNQPENSVLKKLKNELEKNKINPIISLEYKIKDINNEIIRIRNILN